MLDRRGIPYRYREYTEEPLSRAELDAVLGKLGMTPREVLRRRDHAYRELGLDGEEPDGELLDHMAEHPTLLERPIGVLGDRAVVGRPAEKLLELVED